ncbi:MAG: hypothetical protein WC365_09015 [Candidatus Babeliales bacterium]|jgi:hypothetical protein
MNSVAKNEKNDGFDNSNFKNILVMKVEIHQKNFKKLKEELETWWDCNSIKMGGLEITMKAKTP